MKAILLAGGRGTRISRYIKEMPKCCLPINNKPLIRITVELLLSKNIEVAVCTGYKQEAVHKALKGLKVIYFHNPFYKVTNSLGTLWFARDYIDDDVVIMNADVYFDPKILEILIISKNICSIASDSSRCKTGDYFFKTDSNNLILKYGKSLSLEERTEEYVGIAFLKKKFLADFKNQFIELIKKEKYDLWWENILYQLADKKRQIKTIDFKGFFWSEVDFYDEYLRIINHINSK